jgi:hypothetical protein
MNTDEVTELGWDWRTWQYLSTRPFFGGAVHYANLTRGVACAPPNALLCRIQSTQCEAGQWERVLLSVPDDLIARAALGQFIVVHDRSEKSRETRAMWQGLTLAKITMEFSWFGELRSRYSSRRGGESSLQYLRNVASQLPEHVRRKYDYFRDLALDVGTTYATVVSCYSSTAESGCGYVRPREPRFW